LVQGARAKALDQHVGLGGRDQLDEKVLPARIAEVQRDRFLVARDQLGEERGAVPRLAEMPDLIAAPRILDLDDVGAEVAEEHRHRRAGDHLPAVEHRDAGERRRLLGHDVGSTGVLASASASTRRAFTTIA
jgi:hypothetical protein